MLRSRRSAPVVAVLGLTLLVGPALPVRAVSAPQATVALPAAATPGPGPDEAVTPPPDLATGEVVTSGPQRRKRLAVGDSLLVGARSQMRRRGFAVHAKVGRQFSAAPGILRGYGRTLARNVVIELGTNGTVSLATCKRVVRIAGKHRRVFLVNNRVPRSWQDGNNRTLRRCDRAFSAKRVRLIDWHKASAGHRSWFAADGVHHTRRGRAAFVKVIDRAVDKHGI